MGLGLGAGGWGWGCSAASACATQGKELKTRTGWYGSEDLRLNVGRCRKQVCHQFHAQSSFQISGGAKHDTRQWQGHAAENLSLPDRPRPDTREIQHPATRMAHPLLLCLHSACVRQLVNDAPDRPMIGCPSDPGLHDQSDPVSFTIGGFRVLPRKISRVPNSGWFPGQGSCQTPRCSKKCEHAT